MFVRASRIAITAALASAAVIGGCDCGTGPEGGGDGNARIIAGFPDGNTIESDGASRLKITLTATDAKGKPDSSTMTVSTPSGFLSLVDGDQGPDTLQVPIDNGSGEFEFQCEQGSNDRVQLTAENANAKATFRVTCNAPQGPVVINVDDRECAALSADGSSLCNVSVTAVQQAATPIPQAGATVTVAVTAVNPATGRDDIISIGGTRSTSTAFTLGVDGTGSFQIAMPDTGETASLTYTLGQTFITRDLVIIDFPEKQDITITPARANIVGGSSTNIEVKLVDGNGNVPSAINGNTFDISVSAGTLTDGANTGAALTGVAVDATTGKKSVTFNSATVDEPTDITVTVSYRYLPNRDPLVETTTVKTNPQGTVLLNLVFDPDTVRSDSDVAADRQSELTVSFTKDDAPVTGGQVLLTISSDDAARIAFVSSAPGDSANLVTLDAAEFDANGEAVVVVTAIPDVSSAIVRVNAVGTDSNSRSTASAELNVFRAPVLQSIQAFPPEPATIGVRGSRLPTSTVVKFQLRDDANNPMANVPVTFAANSTADRGVVVGQNDISDAQGFVQTVLSAGTIAGPVSVRVTAHPVAVDSGTTPPPFPPTDSPTIAIVGGLPNFLGSFMACDKAIPRVEGTTFSCAATLVDRFSNLVNDQIVQFRAEGSGTNATGVSAGGVVTAGLILDDGDTRSGASITQWSYGTVPDFDTRINPALAEKVSDRYPECFDKTVSTPCDLLALCNDPDTERFCPMPLGCIEDANSAAGFLLLGGDLDTAGVDAYVAEHRSCGFPVSCLLGDRATADGIESFPADNCGVALGCFDYSGLTDCPADGLLTVTASTRGEESFSDGNGNGVFDFVDTNNNGRQDVGELVVTRAERCLQGRCELSNNTCTIDANCTAKVPVDEAVDLPEPFLDKNDSCSRDDFTNVPRFRFTPAERVRHTDLFNDVDGNLLFGFSDATQGLVEKNGVYDPDTEIFLTGHILAFGGPELLFGTPCDPTLNPNDACLEQETPAGPRGINPTGLPTTISRGQSVTIAYRWRDSSGNCPSKGFAQESSATVSGPVIGSGDTNLTLDELACGFAPDSNLLNPYCEEFPHLGSPVGTITVREDCEDEVLDKPVKVEWSLGGVTRSVVFTALCSQP